MYINGIQEQIAALCHVSLCTFHQAGINMADLHIYASPGPLYDEKRSLMQEETARRFSCIGLVLFSNVSCDFIRRWNALRPGTRCLWSRRGPRALHNIFLLLIIYTHTHKHPFSHWNDIRQRRCWGWKGEATVLQFSRNAAWMGGGLEKEKKARAVLGKRLWRLTHCNNPASLLVLWGAPAHWLGNICCFTTGGPQNKAF